MAETTRSQTLLATVRRLARTAAGVVALAILLSGCATSTTLPDEYGKGQGDGRSSVAGTRALADMYRQAGYEVRFTDALGRHLNKARTIVWAPDDFAFPSDEVCDYFEKWLAEQPGRTLVYVGRDYSAPYAYWSDMSDSLKGVEKMQALRHKAEEASELRFEQMRMPEDGGKHRWFVREDAPTMKRTHDLESPAWSGWTSGVDAKKTDLFVRSTLAFSPPPTEEEEADADAATAIVDGEELAFDDYEFDDESWDEEYAPPTKVDPVVLLSVDGRPMVSTATFGGYGPDASALVLVSNGSFLLNYPLTNAENRKLASKLVDECGPPGMTYFLASGPTGLEVRDPRAPRRTAWTMFTEYPLGIFMIHLTIAGLIVCLAAFPIFGRPRSYVTRDLQDFGYHLEAVGRLLERRKAHDFARQKLAAYSEWLRRETGRRHRSPQASAPHESRPDRPPS